MRVHKAQQKTRDLALNIRWAYSFVVRESHMRVHKAQQKTRDLALNIRWVNIYWLWILWWTAGLHGKPFSYQEMGACTSTYKLCCETCWGYKFSDNYLNLGSWNPNTHVYLFSVCFKLLLAKNHIGFSSYMSFRSAYIPVSFMNSHVISNISVKCDSSSTTAHELRSCQCLWRSTSPNLGNWRWFSMQSWRVCARD